MKVNKFGFKKQVNVNLDKYLCDWDHKVSGPQKLVKDFLRPYWEKTNVVLEEFMIPGSRLRMDIWNVSRKIAIEVSPESTHGKFNKFMHGSKEGYKNMFKRDLAKIEWIEGMGLTYVELTDEHFDKLSKKLFEEEFGVFL